MNDSSLGTPRPAQPGFFGLVLLGATCGASLLSSTAVAVDGYKDFKFGMTPQQVRQKSPVPLADVEVEEDVLTTFGRDATMLEADNFPFLGNQAAIIFIFTRKGLAAVNIVLEDTPAFLAVGKSLAEKYGPATLHPSPKEFQKTAQQFDNGEPNKVLKMTFDKDTVVLLAISDAEASKAFILSYTGGPRFIEHSLGGKAQEDL